MTLGSQNILYIKYLKSVIPLKNEAEFMDLEAPSNSRPQNTQNPNL